MLKKVLWIAVACAAVLVVLAVSRGLSFDKPADKPAAPVEAAQEAAPPPTPVEAAPAPPPVAAPPPALTPDEQQIQDDAAATGMTTMEPDAAPAEPPPT